MDYLSVNVYYDPQPWAQAAENINALHERLHREASFCRIVSTVDEIDQARAEKKLAITLDIEGMNALNGDLDMVQRFYDQGVRHMLFAYNRNNAAGSGCHDEDTGLTGFGLQVIDEMNRVGMVIDCSHTGFKTTMAAMERSRAPVVFSHSNARSLVDHGRNITDDQIKACAHTGGVIGVCGVNLFLGEENPSPQAVARHAAYIADITAPQHVGISLDFSPEDEAGDGAVAATMAEEDAYYWPPGAGYDRPARALKVGRLPEVVEELHRNGFDSEEIAGILGGNFRRVAGQVWR